MASFFCPSGGQFQHLCLRQTLALPITTSHHPIFLQGIPKAISLSLEFVCNVIVVLHQALQEPRPPPPPLLLAFTQVPQYS